MHSSIRQISAHLNINSNSTIRFFSFTQKAKMVSKLPRYCQEKNINSHRLKRSRIGLRLVTKLASLREANPNSAISSRKGVNFLQRKAVITSTYSSQPLS